MEHLGRLAGVGQVVPHRYKGSVLATSNCGSQLWLGDHQIAGRREHDRATRRHPSADPGTERHDDGFVDRSGQEERESGARRRASEWLDPHEIKEMKEQLVGNLVEPEEDHLGHPRKELDERDPRIGHVVVGPLGAVVGDLSLCLVDDLLERSVVEVWDGKRHSSSSRGMT